MNIPVANCSSCGACVNACACGAISMRQDSEGFFRPIIESEKCISCGACERACPWMHSVVNPNNAKAVPETFAAYAKKDSVRMKSSSGGIFTVLAEKILDEGGVVVGVAQTESKKFRHVVVKEKTELVKLRGSKYVQADAGFIYKAVRDLLKQGHKVLFSGTPCQVAALYSVLGKTEYPHLFTVDIVCHGTPSVKVFEKYIDEIENSQSARVLSTSFRDKRKGWRLYSMTSSLSSLNGDNYQIAKTLREDKFMRVFLQNICLNLSCSDCKYAKLPRIADITLGDYWNIAKIHPEMDDDKGTSVVLLNDEHGKDLYDSIAGQIVQCESKIESAVAGNPCIVRPSKPHLKRTAFFADLDNFALKELIKKYCPYPSLLEQFFYRVRRVLSRVKRMFAR